ncbi:MULTISPECIES: PLDc N-terminal domain-containing protein [Streptomyces]|uniref:Cardiolipin synthase N-terminal domain-containing protein n=2 Tax=Streptomyces TaxID=1883 RepID=A0A2U9NW48_STRAS|nr:PLDc N-terminal domain-containing protein [Streptomyces actuosus]AWT41513.1 hypothetical protein DMT42_03745 [Streptomyces actuosus]MBM4825921.1 PLDc N-terminal domain-containing protein [Streptomyces actuosus]
MLAWLTYVLFALVAVMYVHSLIDCVRTPSARVRCLPKPLWLLFMLWAPILGSLTWTYFGKLPEQAKTTESGTGAGSGAREPIRA